MPLPIARCAVINGDTSAEHIVEELTLGTVTAVGRAHLAALATFGGVAVVQTARSALTVFFNSKIKIIKTNF